MSAPGVSAATTVESTRAAVESATHPTMKSTTDVTVEATDRTMRKAASTYEAASTEPRTSGKAMIEAAPIKAAPEATVKTTSKAAAPTSPTPRASPAPPRAGANEYAAREPTGSVIPVRSASVRVISVITVVAYRRPANSNTDRNLCLRRLRVSQRQHQYRNQSQIFHVPHVIPLVSDPPFPPDLPAFRFYFNLNCLCI
jgi:hypothetical protein